MKPFGIVYVATNAKNGKQYVGQTVHSLKWRWGRHRDCAKRNVRGLFLSAIRKYGPDSFSIEQIDQAWSRKELDAQETWWILLLRTVTPYGYNVSAGGRGNSGFHLSDETKRRIAESLTGQVVSQETRLKLSRLHAGKPKSAAMRAKMSSLKKGVTYSKEVRQRMSEAHKGVKLSPERCAAMSRERIRTHCRRGHLFTEESSYVRPSGGRQCRICMAEFTKRHIRQPVRKHRVEMCKRGHPFVDGSFSEAKNGGRACKKCAAIWYLEKRQDAGFLLPNKLLAKWDLVEYFQSREKRAAACQ